MRSPCWNNLVQIPPVLPDLVLDICQAIYIPHTSFNLHIQHCFGLITLAVAVPLQLFVILTFFLPSASSASVVALITLFSFFPHTFTHNIELLYGFSQKLHSSTLIFMPLSCSLVKIIRINVLVSYFIKKHMHLLYLGVTTVCGEWLEESQWGNSKCLPSIPFANGGWKEEKQVWWKRTEWIRWICAFTWTYCRFQAGLRPVG